MIRYGSLVTSTPLVVASCTAKLFAKIYASTQKAILCQKILKNGQPTSIISFFAMAKF